MKTKLNLDLSQSIKRLKFITTKLVNTKIVGGYRSVFRGSGLEFFDYRHYTPDDDAATIDWRASIRSKELLVREFAEERNLNVFFLVDVSSSMVYGSIDKLKIEYAAELLATLGYTILQAGDSMGFALFTDKIIRVELPKSGFSQYNKLISVLVDPRYYGGNYDLVEALKFTMAYLKEFSIVVIVSDFIGLKSEWERYIKTVGKKFDLIGIMIRDPIDRMLPEYNGNVIFQDPYSSKQLIVNADAIKEDYERYAEAKEKEVNRAFTNAGSDFILLTTDKPFLKPVVDLFIRRARKA